MSISNLLKFADLGMAVPKTPKKQALTVFDPI